MTAARLAIVVGLASCGGTPTEDAPAWPDMEARRLLVRASLDLRGVRPTVEEWDRLDQNPAVLDSMIAEFAEDPRFGPRMADLYAEVLLTRTETWPVNAASYGSDLDQVAFLSAVGDEVPHMVGRVAAEDLPWTEMVVGDWTMSNDVLRQVWPVESESSGWAVSRYTDGRPAAGALATNSLWWRYGSTFSNANRKRANAASRIFLCQDYLHKPIAFDRNVNLLDEGAVNDALTSNPGCVSCHVSLDPMAGYFYGFWYYNENLAAEVTEYHPERELLWRSITGIAPGYYGQPGFSLDELGRQIAADPRYPQCAVETVTSQLLRRDLALEDTDRLVAHREAFLAGGLTLRSLAKSVVQSPEYRAGVTDDPLAVPSKLVTPDLLHDQIEDLTGYRWTAQGGLDLLRSEMVGYRTLAGGADGQFVTRNADRPSATLLLVQARLAEAAAEYVVRRDLRDPTQARLLTGITGEETPEIGREAMVAQIQALHLRMFGTRVAAEGPEVEANLALWQDLYTISGQQDRAWIGLVTALLRDPDLILY